MMESIVRDKVASHMELNDLFSNNQHGFVPNRNCMTNHLTCMELWTEMTEKGLPIDIIYTDFAKAFDRIPHRRLLQKLMNIGITGITLRWVEAFHNERSQCVKVENEVLSRTQVISGIPQGSVLGPILFVIFINNLPDIVENTCQLFAGDAKIFRSVETIDGCRPLHLGRTNRRHVYELGGQKDLGVIVDDELKFHEQTAAAVKKANTILGLARKSFAVLDSNTVPVLYNSLVRPHLEYGNVIWGPFFKENITAVQESATKSH